MTTPKVLTEADAAADLAGLPRAVSEPSELTLILAERDRDCLYSRTGDIKDINTVLISREQLRALAGRVAELEAERDRWHQRARELLAAFGEPQPFTHQGMFDRPMTFGGCPFCGRKECVAGECRAALSATTPESKP